MRLPILPARLDAAGAVALVDRFRLEEVEVTGDLSGRRAADVVVPEARFDGVR